MIFQAKISVQIIQVFKVNYTVCENQKLKIKFMVSFRIDVRPQLGKISLCPLRVFVIFAKSYEVERIFQKDCDNFVY